MSRAVLGRPLIAWPVFADEFGVPVPADQDEVTCVLKDAAGTDLATVEATVAQSGVGYRAQFAPQLLGRYSVVATGSFAGVPVEVSVPVRVVARHVVERQILRVRGALDGVTPMLFLAIADAAEDWLTALLGYSPVATSDVLAWDLQRPTARPLEIPADYVRRIEHLAVNGTELALPHRGLWPAGQYMAIVEHGRWDSPPADIQRALSLLCDHLATADSWGVPMRATKVAVDGAETWLSTPNGGNRLTGIPEADAILARYRGGQLPI